MVITRANNWKHSLSWHASNAAPIPRPSIYVGHFTQMNRNSFMCYIYHQLKFLEDWKNCIEDYCGRSLPDTLPILPAVYAMWDTYSNLHTVVDCHV